MLHRMTPRPEFVARLSAAFLNHGYDQLNMMGLAKAMDMTRRSLYNYFSNKEEAFRFWIEQENAIAVALGMAAGRAQLSGHGDPVDVLTQVINIRYGENRRRLMSSPHATEINDQAFRRCRDQMIQSAISFQSQLADLIAEMQQSGLLILKPTAKPEALAQLIADGARGTNQSLPPIASDDLESRYRQMVAALLYGTIHG